MLTATAPKLRASKLPLITLCPKSALLDDEPIDSEDSPARLGSAFHQIIAKHVMGHQTYDDIDQTADLWQVPSEELRILWHCGIGMWSKIHHYYPDVIAETEQIAAYFPDEITPITGHIDLVSMQNNEVRFADWKTGWDDEFDYWPQMAAYAYILFALNPSLERCHGSILWVRNGDMVSYTFTRTQIMIWANRVLDRLAEANYNPGDHCPKCTQRLNCKPYAALQASYVQTLRAWPFQIAENNASPTQKAETLLDLYQNAAQIKKVCEEVMSFVKSHVEARGEIEARGKVMRIEGKERSEITGQALSYLAKKFESDFSSAAKVNKEDLRKAVFALIPRGEKGNVWEATLRELEQNDMIKTKVISTLQITKS